MKRKIRVLAAVCAAILLFGCTTAMALEGAKPGTSGQLSDTIYWTLSEAGELTIEGSGAMPDFGNDENTSPFAENDQIRSIRIGEGITTIGDRIFMDDLNLLSVSIPTSVKTIGYCSFCRTGLQDVVIPADVTIIGEGAFYNCIDLWKVTILTYSAEVYEGTFDLCDDDLEIYGWKGSGAEAFATEYGYTFKPIQEEGDCGSDATWTLDPISGGMTITGTGAIRNNAFEWNEIIRSVTIGSGITKIGSCAFRYCTNLADVSLPEGLTTISEGAFQNCTGLEEITIPDSVTGILEGAFDGCTRIASIKLPKKMNRMGGYLFRGCINLTEITLPEELEAVPSGIFWGCSGLKSVTIPMSTGSIEGYAFTGCESLEEIILPEGLSSIGEAAFNGCKGIGNITIPRNTGEIRDWAFYGCKKLKEATILNTNAEFGEDVFASCPSDLTLRGWTNSTAQAYATEEQIHFEEIELPEANFVLPEDLTEIGEEAFSNTDVTSVVIPRGVTQITWNPFAGSKVIVIYGYAGSVAETFAEEYGYMFVALEDN